MAYADYLNSEHWKETRYKYIKNLKKKFGRKVCEICKWPIGLKLHHKTYRSLGKEKQIHLIMLCERCHSSVHLWQKLLKRNLWETTIQYGKHYKHFPGIHQRYKRCQTCEKIMNLNDGHLKAQETIATYKKYERSNLEMDKELIAIVG